MEKIGSILSIKTGMADTLHNNGREHQLPGGNFRIVHDIYGNGGLDYSNPIINWFHNLNKKMAQLKIGWLILAHGLTTGLWGYALYVEWGTWQGYILGGIGIIVAIFQAIRIGIKVAKEWYEFRGQVRDFNKPLRT